MFNEKKVTKFIHQTVAFNMLKEKPEIGIGEEKRE